MNEAQEQASLVKAKNAMSEKLHLKEKQREDPKTQSAAFDLIKDIEKKKKEVTIKINKDLQQQRESVQHRLAQRKNRAANKSKLYNSVLHTSNLSLATLKKSTDPEARGAGSTLVTAQGTTFTHSVVSKPSSKFLSNFSGKE